MHKAVTVNARTDLRPFLTILKSYQIWHHVTEESGTLVLWAIDEVQAGMIASAYDQWQAGTLDTPEFHLQSTGKEVPLVPVKTLAQSFINALWLAPVTVTLIIASVVVASVSNVGTHLEPVSWLLFPDIAAPGQFPLSALISGLDSPARWLQTLTPVFLHFGAVHIIMNMLWLWYLGRLMEPVLGKSVYAGAIVLMAFGGNVAQFLWSGNNAFGGMSGVVYGQLGLIWMWQTLRPHTRLFLPLPMIMMFLVAMVLMGILAPGIIATAAHVGGLLTGMLCGLALAMLYRSGKYGR